MRVTIDPPANEWRIEQRGAAARSDLDALGVPAGATVIATGHQAWHWHPGILSKYLAASTAAKRHDAVVIDVVVDQDVYDPLRIELPVKEGSNGDRLTVQSVELGKTNGAVPPGMQAPVDRDAVMAAVDALSARHGDRLAVDLSRLRSAWAQSSDDESLAAQTSQVLHQLMSSWTAPMVKLTATRLVSLPASRQIVELMLRDAANCITHYNAAVEASRGAGLAPLSVERERIELPLWWLRPNEPRRRVFADVADSTALLVDERGEAIDSSSQGDLKGEGVRGLRPCLAPRAMLLTALMRAFYCDFFIHGTGGGVYDRVTEAWWLAWRGETLAPLAVVTADVQLSFPGVPVATKQDVERAVWYAHHLPHNLDRHLPPESVPQDLVQRKQELLQSRAVDFDRKSRRRSFEEMHRIDARLAQDHAEMIRLAQAQVERAEAGFANAQVAQKRDWFFGLYDDDTIDALANTIDRALG